MELARSTIEVYLRRGFDQLSVLVDRIGDERLNLKPAGEHTNTAAVIVTHVCGALRFWAMEVGLGHDAERDRPAEFEAVATVAELHALIDRTVDQLLADVAEIEAGATTPVAGRRALWEDEVTDGSIILHLLEELYQHIGQLELTADALGVSPA
jgi:hypothetical protein